MASDLGATAFIRREQGIVESFQYGTDRLDISFQTILVAHRISSVETGFCGFCNVACDFIGP